MKLLLIRPPFTFSKYYLPRPVDEPLGIEYLTAWLRQYHHDVDMIDAIAWAWNNYWLDARYQDIVFQGLKPAVIINKIKQYQPDIIGLTWLFSTQNKSVELLINEIKTYNNKIKILVGGPQASANPREILGANPAIDAVICGEGELTIKEILDNRNWRDINGLAYREQGEIKINQIRQFITNLDILPFPYREQRFYLNYSKQYFYQALFVRLKRLKLSFRYNNIISAAIGSLPLLNYAYYFLYNRHNKDKLLFADMVTSRGCPNHCTFCAIHSIWGHTCRMRTPQNVLAEIDFLVSKFGVKHVNFQDDNFNVNKQRTIAICRGIVDNKYKITLSAPSGVFVPALDEEVLTWLKRAGFFALRMSIESGNQQILTNVIRKNIDLSRVKAIVDICRKLEIYTEGAFIFGIPGETIETMQDSLNFAKQVGFDRVIKFIFQPFPNTELYDQCVSNGFLTPDYDPNLAFLTSEKCFVKTDKFTPADVYKLARS